MSRHGARVLAGSVLALLWTLAAREAQATPQLRLVYIREAGTEGCPVEMELRMAVAARLGYDPFRPTASGAIVARLSKVEAGLAGSIEIIDEAGISRGRRELSSDAQHCDELARAMARSISIAVDPEAGQPGEPERAPGLTGLVPGVSAERPVEEDTPPELDAEPERETDAGVTFAASALILSLFGVTPSPAFGGGAAGSAVPLSGVVELVGQGELLAALPRNRAEIDDREVWTAPPVIGGVGLGIEAHFR